MSKHADLNPIRDYARQRLRGHTRLARADYIAAVVDYAKINNIDELQAARTARYAWDSRWGRTDPERPQEAPERPEVLPASSPSESENAAVAPSEPQPDHVPVPPPEVGPQEPYSLQDLLRRADMEGGPIEVPPLPAPASPVIPEPLPPAPVDDLMTDATRRRAAKAAVRKAVADVNRVTNEQYLLYHQAMLVRNRNVKAMTEMEIAAAVEKITVQQLADRIITEWEARCRRAAYVYALEAQALKDIDEARGDDIETIARTAAAEITGDDA